MVAKAGGRDPNGSRDPVVFHGYRPSKGLTKSLTNAADMSGSDSKRDVVMMSGNWFCDVSNDGGANWKRLDPTTIFPEDLGNGFLLRPGRRLRAPHRPLHLVPAVQRGRGRPGAFRIASASSASVKNDPTAWTYWDFVAGDFGYPTKDMDYPDLAFSTTFLYVSTDVFGAGGRIVLRIPLQEPAGRRDDQLRLHGPDEVEERMGRPPRPANALPGRLGRPPGQHDARGVHDAGRRQHLLVLHRQGRHLAERQPQLDGPGRERLADEARDFPNFAVTGGVERPNGNVVLAWSASKGKGASNGFNFPNTHGRVVELDLVARSVVSEMQIWNPDYAFAYPALAVSSKDEVGVILGWGGASNHANCAMGIIGDFVVWYQNGSTRTVKRYGDYPDHPPGRAEPAVVRRVRLLRHERLRGRQLVHVSPDLRPLRPRLCVSSEQGRDV